MNPGTKVRIIGPERNNWCSGATNDKNRFIRERKVLTISVMPSLCWCCYRLVQGIKDGPDVERFHVKKEQVVKANKSVVIINKRGTKAHGEEE